MINDPNELYAGKQEDPQPKVPSKGTPRDLPVTSAADEYLKWRDASGQNMSRAGQSFQAPKAYSGDYKKYFGDTGVYDPALTGNDIGLTMGERQTWGDKLARRLGTFVPNVVAGLIDMVGYTGAMFTEIGDNRDYSNFLTQAAQGIREWSKDNIGATYRRSNDTWALSDPTWWIDNVFDTGEWAASFAIGGAGIGKVLGSTAKGLSTALNLGTKGSRLVMQAAQLGTSGLVSYAEAAQAGGQVFSEVYKNQLMKALADGMDQQGAEDHAKHIAAQSAATAAQLGTLLTMGLNVGAYAPLFRSQGNVANEIITKRLAQLEGSSMKGFGAAIRGMNATDYMDKLIHHQGLKGMLREMAGEGGEEFVQQFAQDTGTNLGNKNKEKGFFEQFGELENIIDRTANSQGLLAFTLGAAFGGLQHGLLHNVIPSRRVEKLSPDGSPIQRMNSDGSEALDKNGNAIVEKHWVTPRKYERDFTQQSFNSVRDAVASDFEHHSQLEDEFLAARKKGNPLEADEARDRMFDPTKLHAIRYGMTEPWIKTFENIANLDNEKVDEKGETVAMQAGYADEPGTDLHKKAAQDAIRDIKHLTTVYEGLQNTYNTRYPGNEHIQPFVDMVFAREADLYSTRNRIDKYKHQLADAVTKEEAMAQITDPEGFSKAVHQYMRERDSARTVEAQLVDDHKKLMSGKPNEVARLLRKYRAIGMGDGRTAEAVKVLDEKLRRKQQELSGKVTNAEQGMLNSTEFQKWLGQNEGGSFDQYLKEVAERNSLSKENRSTQAQIDLAETQYEIARQHLSEMTKEKNVFRFTKKVSEWQEKLVREAEEVENRNTETLAEMTKDKSNLTRLQKIGLNRIADKYRGDQQVVLQRIANNNQRIEDAKKELDQTRRDPLRSMALRRQIKQMAKENEMLGLRARTLESLYVKHKVDMTPDEEPVPVEKVTGEDSGMITQDANEEPTTNTTTEEPVELNMTADELFADIEGASPLAEMTDAPATIQDELEALTRELEQASAVEEGITIEQEYANLLGHINNAMLRSEIERIVDGLVDGTVGFSLDLLNQYVRKGHLTQGAATQLLQTAKVYADQLRELKTAATTEVSPEEVIPEDLPQVQVTGPENPDTPIVSQLDANSMVIPENEAYHAGYKIIDAATTGATSTIAYEEGTRKDKNGKTVYVKVTKPQELLQPASEDILLPGKLLPGTELIYEVDVDYDGPKHITDSLSWDSNGEVVQTHEKGIDYLDAAGKVKTYPTNVGNVPIRVKDGKTGKFLFHIRTLDWLHAKFPGTKDYRNVVDKIETKDGFIDNLAIQTQKLMEMRTAIVEKFNKEGKPMDGKIAAQGKGTGRLILNFVVESKDPETLAIKSKVQHDFAVNKRNPDRSMLPDKSLELVIVMGNGEVPHSALNSPTSKPLGFSPKDLVKGAVGALVPAANGQFLYAPLLGMKLVEEGKPSPALNSVTRAIELFLLNDGSDDNITNEIDQLEANTGFNVGIAKGLRGFINQYYTYLQGFQDSALSPNASTGIKAEQFLFNVDDRTNIADKTKQIKIGFSMRGDGAKYANLLQGKLDPAFVQVLAEGFASRSRAVVFSDNRFGIKGLNSEGKFYDAVYTPDRGWKHNEYESYNEYVKSFSRTPVYGRNKVGGTYVYTANPHLPIEIPDMRHNAVLVEEAKNAETVKPVEGKTYQADVDLFDTLANNMPRVTRTVEAFGTGSDQSQPLSLKTLQDLYNFTSEAERNGRTPMEVYEDLSARGHSYISKGYNPFSRCL